MINQRYLPNLNRGDLKYTNYLCIYTGKQREGAGVFIQTDDVTIDVINHIPNLCVFIYLHIVSHDNCGYIDGMD